MKNKEFSKSRFAQLSEWGSKLGLSFSSHVLLGDRIIALDGLRKKLLVLETVSLVWRPSIIRLSELKSVSLKKNYGFIKAGDLVRKKFDDFLENVHLVFEYANGVRTVVLPFYERGKNRLSDLPVLERNARNWQMILSRMTIPSK